MNNISSPLSINDNDDNDHHDNNDDERVLLCEIFEGVIQPDIYINNDTKMICIPERYTIHTEGSQYVYDILTQPNVFIKLSISLQKGFLDIMYLILRRSSYDVIRFLFYVLKIHQIDISINHLLLNLLNYYKESHECLSISKRIIRLLGIVSGAGISVIDLKEYLSLLRFPTLLSLSLLQSLKTMIKQNNTVTKACPYYFFNFGGYGAGIHSLPTPFPFAKEYHLFTWFRVESFKDNSNNINNIESNWKQHIMSVINSTGQGIDIYLEDNHIMISVVDHRNKSWSFLIPNALKRGVWYHISVRHSKPRLSLFARDQMTIHLDHQLVFEDYVKYPSYSYINNVIFSCGQNFNGQIGSAYYLSELVSPQAVETISRYDACKCYDGPSNSPASDLLQTIVSADRKQSYNGVTSKLTTVYHPLRYGYGCALDIHSGRHGVIYPFTNSWNIVPAKQTLASLGGVSCLLPLFPRLLIENDDIRSTFCDDAVDANALENSDISFTVNVGLGNSLCPINEDADCKEIFDASIFSHLESEGSDITSESCVALLLGIIGSCIENHHDYKRELMHIKGIQMISYALSSVPGDLMQGEGDGCMLALLQLQTIADDSKSLENAITKNLIANSSIWSKGSHKFQNGLMSVLLAAVRAKPQHYLELLGVQGIINNFAFYMDNISLVSSASKNNMTSLNETISKEDVTQNSKEPNENGIERRLSATGAKDSFKLAISRELNATTVDDIPVVTQEVSELLDSPEDILGTKASLDNSILSAISIDSDRIVIDNDTTSPEEYDRSRTFSEVSGPTIPDGAYDDLLLREHRRCIREYLRSMLITLVLHGGSKREIRPILQYMAICNDKIVLNEVAHTLLYLIIEGGNKIISAVTEVCKGPEEFASFVLQRLVNHQAEELRCSGIRLLTHFYLRIDALPVTLLTMTIPRRGGNVISRALEKLSMLSGGLGMQRLVVCGGLAILHETLSLYAHSSSDLTYSTLLEMFLTRSGTSNNLTEYMNSFDENALLSAPSPSHSPQRGAARSMAFTTAYLNLDMSDENQDTCNAVILPIFFELLPKLPVSIHYQILTDLLALLKHSIGVRNAFCSYSSWHFCLFGIVSTLIISSNSSVPYLKSGSIVEELNKYISDSSINAEEFSSPMARSTSSQEFDAEKDTMFAIGMKIYAILLRHSMFSRGGWRETERALSQAYDSQVYQKSFSQTVLSHTVSEISFTMKSTYRDLLKLAKSKNQQETHKAMDRMENILSFLISAAQFVLDDEICVTKGIPHWIVGKLRVRCHNQLMEEKNGQIEVGTNKWSDEIDVEDFKNRQDDNYSESSKNTSVEFLSRTEKLLHQKYFESKKNVDDPLEHLLNLSYEWASPKVLVQEYGINSYGKKFRSDENLHPLERGHDLEEGRLILILQILRMFDELFWPDDNAGKLRNQHMLRFQKESVDQKDQPERDNLQKKPDLTLFSAMMRTFLYIHSTLSPLIDLTFHNITRMRLLLESSHKVAEQPITTPVDDWLVAACLHVSLNLQRLSKSLKPIFEMIGITEDLEIKIIGNLASTTLSMQRYVREEEIFESAMNDSAIQRQLQKLFDTGPGNNLIRYVIESIKLLKQALERSRQVLQKAIDIEVLAILEIFVQRFNHDFSSEVDAATDIRSQSVDSSNSFSSFDEVEDFEYDENHNLNESKNESLDYDFTPRMILSILRLLRHPFLWKDLLRNNLIVLSIAALERHESECMKCFIDQILDLRNKMERHRQAWMGVHEEVQELKVLSGTVYKMMVQNEKIRKATNKAVELPEVRRVATCWDECLRKFDYEWSPWFVHDNDKSGGSNKVQYVTSKHRDSRMRRMLLIKSHEFIDHSHEGYQQGKTRDPHVNESSQSDLSQWAKLRSATLHSEMAASNAWAEDSNETEVEVLNESMTSTSTAGKNIAEKTADIIGLGINKLAVNIVEKVVEKQPPPWVLAFSTWSNDEKIQHTFEAMRIELEIVILGDLILSNKNVFFHPKKAIGGLSDSSKSFKDKRWHLDRLIEAYGRRYLLQNCGIELFFADVPEVFFAFKSTSDLQRFFRSLRRQHTPLMPTSISRSLNPQYVLQHSPWTDLWRRRLISNFEYLMRLNLIAGRSYNDITQYPVFPWIIADYTSQTLDLTNPATFRDLSKPIGALNRTRLKEIIDRFNSFDDDSVPKFMYGSHYSTAGIVINFMIRQEPFTTLGINLQGGRFDCPDRLFFDIASSWNGCNQSISDVKELIPELFCCPELFLNLNNLPLGELQDERPVRDVILPPWAKDAYEFVRLNREALESDYVSEHLNEWIDLIFGYKQRGIEAERAFNLFYYLTYENCSIDIDNIEDPLQREATKAQVTHFGQTPSQLFPKDPHPRRLPAEECMTPLCSDPENLSKIKIFTPPKQLAEDGSHGAAISVRCSSDQRTLIVCHADLSLCYYRWSTFPDGEGLPFQVKADRGRVLPSAEKCKSEDILKRISYIPKIASTDNSSNTVPVSLSPTSTVPRTPTDTTEGSDSSKKRTSLHFDSLRRSLGRLSMSSTPNATPSTPQNDCADRIIYSPEDGTMYYNDPLPAITCKNVALSVGEQGHGRILSTGYWDNSLKVHSLDQFREIASGRGGHIGEITCVQLGYQGGHTLVTGGEDGTCRVWVLESPSLAAAFSTNPCPDDDLSYDSTLACVHVLWGHQYPISAISYAHDLDLLLSADVSGMMCLHTVRKGNFIRSIDHTRGLGDPVPVTAVLTTSPGYLVSHSGDDLTLNLFWINGQHLETTKVPSRIDLFAMNGPSNILVCGGSDGIIYLRTIHDLDLVHIINQTCIHGAITSLCFSEDYQFLLIGSENGTFSIATDPDMRWQVLQTAFQKLPLLGPTL